MKKLKRKEFQRKLGMTMVRGLQVLFVYLLILLEKQYTVFLSNFENSNMNDVISDIDKFKTLFIRVFALTVIYSVIYFVWRLLFN